MTASRQVMYQHRRKTLPASGHSLARLCPSQSTPVEVGTEGLSLLDPHSLDSAPNSPWFGRVSSKITQFSNIFRTSEEWPPEGRQILENPRLEEKHLDTSEENDRSLFRSTFGRLSPMLPSLQIPHLPDFAQIPSPIAVLDNFQRNLTQFVAVCLFFL